MGKQKSTETKSGKTGRHIVGKDAFGKIGAVEGIHLSATMKKRASDARAKGLSADEYRETIIRSHRKG